MSGSRRIWKWQLEYLDVQELSLPLGYQVMTVQMQGGAITAWIMFDVEQSDDKWPVEFYVVGTGNPVPNGAKRYVGTVQDSHGLVWHIFETPSHGHPLLA